MSDNLAGKGGGVCLEDIGYNQLQVVPAAIAPHEATVAVNSFNANQTTTVGGEIFTLCGILTLQGESMFNGNNASMTGRGMHAFDSSLHFPGGS